MRLSYPTNRDYWHDGDFQVDESSGSPENECFDFCKRCFSELDVQDWFLDREPELPFAMIDELNEEWACGGEDHPPYTDDEYWCASCNRKLLDMDN